MLLWSSIGHHVLVTGKYLVGIKPLVASSPADRTTRDDEDKKTKKECTFL